MVKFAAALLVPALAFVPQVGGTNKFEAGLSADPAVTAANGLSPRDSNRIAFRTAALVAIR